MPIPPELVAILRGHIETFGIAPDGRLFRSERGQVVASPRSATCGPGPHPRAHPGQVASPLAGRPYDLRHAAVSLWLNAGVPAPEVAERAGHSVEVLLRVYAKCLDGGEDIANRRIGAALRDGDARPGACLLRSAFRSSSAQISGRSSHEYPATTGKRRHLLASSCATPDGAGDSRGL